VNAKGQNTAKIADNMKQGKVRIATVWLCGCSGCHMSFLDLDERLVELAERIELLHSPIADVKDIPEVDVGIVEGGVANEENLHVLKKIRERAKILVSLGDCAGFGCVPMLRNLYDKNEVLERAYIGVESTALGEVPAGEDLPKLFDKVRPIHEFVEVDVHLPGCPPDADAIWTTLKALLEGKVPELCERLLRYD